MPSHTHTAQYWFIELALDARARSFGELERQMDAFRPLPLEAFEAEWQQMWAQMRPLNPGMPDEDLKHFINSQIANGRSDQMQYMNAFLEPFAAEAVAITVLSHALIEATINAALALGLAHMGKFSHFTKLERTSVINKWTVGPQSFLASYTFSRSDALFEELSNLCRRRNAYVHSKITLRDQSDQVLLVGSADAGISIGKEARALLHQFLLLPYRLHQHLLLQIEDQSLRFILERILKEQNDRTQ